MAKYISLKWSANPIYHEGVPRLWPTEMPVEWSWPAVQGPLIMCISWSKPRASFLFCFALSLSLSHIPQAPYFERLYTLFVAISIKKKIQVCHQIQNSCMSYRTVCIRDSAGPFQNYTGSPMLQSNGYYSIFNYNGLQDHMKEIEGEHVSIYPMKIIIHNDIRKA